MKKLIRVSKKDISRCVRNGIIVLAIAGGGFVLGYNASTLSPSLKEKSRKLSEKEKELNELANSVTLKREEILALDREIKEIFKRVATTKGDSIYLNLDSRLFKADYIVTFRYGAEVAIEVVKTDHFKEIYDRLRDSLNSKEKKIVDSLQIDRVKKTRELTKAGAEAKHLLKPELDGLKRDLRRTKKLFGIIGSSAAVTLYDLKRRRRKRSEPKNPLPRDKLTGGRRK